jgi:hypothetical protein
MDLTEDQMIYILIMGLDQLPIPLESHGKTPELGRKSQSYHATKQDAK